MGEIPQQEVTHKMLLSLLALLVDKKIISDKELGEIQDMNVNIEVE